MALEQYEPAEADYRVALHLHSADADAVNSLALLDHQRGRKWSAVRGLLGVERPDPTYQDMMPRTSVRSSPGCCVGRRGWC